MSLRYCVYKDCHNYFNLTTKTYSKEDLTFFQFPKDRPRREKWMELGKAQENLPASYYLYCSEHFDEKYKVKQFRRTILIGEAVPYPHEPLIVRDQTEVVDSFEFATDNIEVDYYLLDDENNEIMTADNQEQEQHIQVESTTISDESIIQFAQSVTDTDYDLSEINKMAPSETKQIDKCAPKRLISVTCSKSYSTENAKKIKIDRETLLTTSDSNPDVTENSCRSLLAADNSPNKSCSNKRLLNSTGRRKIENDVDEYLNLDNTIDPDALVNSESVTVFIFQGKEYVQMPKDYYIKEKLVSMQKLKKLEDVIEGIKLQLSTL